MDDESDFVGPDAALLPRSPSVILNRDNQRDPIMTQKGIIRAYWLGTVVCMGGFLFGYDSGIIGKHSRYCVVLLSND